MTGAPRIPEASAVAQARGGGAGEPVAASPGCGGRAAGALAVAFGALYLLNPGWGVFELLPDALPVVGNLDEAGATALLLWGLARLRHGSRRGPGGSRSPQA